MLYFSTFLEFRLNSSVIRCVMFVVCIALSKVMHCLLELSMEEDRMLRMVCVL
jgi:hypothetical protein